MSEEISAVDIFNTNAHELSLCESENCLHVTQHVFQNKRMIEPDLHCMTKYQVAGNELYSRL